MNDLPVIVDIFDDIVAPEQDDNDIDDYCNEDDQDVIIEHVLEELHEYIQCDPRIYDDPKFNEIINDFIQEHLDNFLENIDSIDHTDSRFEILNEILITKIKQFYFSVFLRRSHKDNLILHKQNDISKKVIKNKLDYLDELNNSLPEQRTAEWFEMRYNLLSASSIWKAIGTQSSKNAIIYDKCKPLDTAKYSSVNINSPFHWGQKYEPVSQMYYEYKYDATIKEYGCIPHKTLDFIGASPDGINVKTTSERYGRMLEVKNVVSRVITGIPKKDYWIQTQLQMETCDLNECDFLECKFIEYKDEDEFNQDGEFNISHEGHHKGVIIYFDNKGFPSYEYMPFNLTEIEYKKWYEHVLNTNIDKTWITNIYWRLDNVSCVLIERNRLWFNSVVDEFKEIWDIIIKERETGYDHRMPKKRVIQGDMSLTAEFECDDPNVKVIEKNMCALFLNDTTIHVTKKEAVVKPDTVNLTITIDTGSM